MFKGKFFLIFSILFITIKIFAASYEIGTDIGFTDSKINIIAEMLAAKNYNTESLLLQQMRV